MFCLTCHLICHVNPISKMYKKKYHDRKNRISIILDTQQILHITSLLNKQLFVLKIEQN